MRHKESELQILCVKYFRAKYPEYTKLLFHPKNEESSGSRSRGAISKAEGVVAGVADLILLAPSSGSHFLAIEMKTKTGRQSDEQKEFQRYVEAVHGHYAVVRSYEDFVGVVDCYMNGQNRETKSRVAVMHHTIQSERDRKAKEEYQKLINKSNQL